MKYDVTYSCGHEGVVQLYGKGSERERKIEWYESCGLCPECYKAHMREEEAKLVKDIESKFDLPQLVGTPKQIEWAVKIRAKGIARFPKQLTDDYKLFFEVLSDPQKLAERAAEQEITSDDLKARMTAFLDQMDKLPTYDYEHIVYLFMTTNSAKTIIDNRSWAE